MKTTAALLLLTLSSLPALAGNWFGPGPWSNYGPYPGYLNGRYTAIVTAATPDDVISGVIGFALVDGSPPFRIEDDQSSSGGNNPVPIVNQQIEPDPAQNYFAIFVEGRTYTGITWPAVDLESNQVAGTLQGRSPAGFLPLGPEAGDLEFNVGDALSIINRGLSGSFNAAIQNKTALFNFQGSGRLSTPANLQTNTITVVPTEANSLTDPLVPTGTITNEVISAQIITASTPFNIRGIRVANTAANPAAQRDAREFQQGGN
jgi:hypothetical protein